MHAGANRSGIAIMLVISTVCIVFANFAVLGRPSGNLWIRLGLLASAVYVLVAILLRWTIHMGKTIVFANDKPGRVFAIVYGTILYAWSMYSLFVLHDAPLFSRGQ